MGLVTRRLKKISPVNYTYFVTLHNFTKNSEKVRYRHQTLESMYSLS